MPESHHDIIHAKEKWKLLTNEDLPVEKAIRVGKPNKNGIRALTFKQFKGCRTSVIKGRRVYVSADLTPMQSENIMKLKEEGTSRKHHGENVMKFVKGFPILTNGNADSKNVAN